MTGSGTSGRGPAASGRIPELAGIVLLGALLLLHIPDSVLACAWLLCSALALKAPVSPFSARLPVLGLIAAGLVMGAGPQQDAMLVAVSLLLLCTLEEMLWRLLLLASLVGVMSSGQVHGITGLCIGGALASVVGSRRLRVASIGAGALIGLLLLGPPDAAVYPGRVALAGVHRDSGGILISWEQTEVLDRSSPAVTYRVPAAVLEDATACTLLVMFETGGLRSPMPPGFIQAERAVAPIVDGWASLPLDAISPEAVAVLEREYAPFEHPVVYSGPARLRLELPGGSP